MDNKIQRSSPVSTILIYYVVAYARCVTRPARRELREVAWDEIETILNCKGKYETVKICFLQILCNIRH